MSPSAPPPDAPWWTTPAPGRHRLLEHPADLRLGLEASDPAALYRTAVQALASVVAAETRCAPPDAHPHPVTLAGTDPADLLVQLLNECLYLLEVHAAVAVDLELDQVTDTELAGSLRLAAPAEPAALLAVKAATYGDLRWERTPAGITAEITLDL